MGAIKRLMQKRLVQDTKGLTTVEYIIILGLVAVVGLAVWKNFGDKVRQKAEDQTGAIDSWVSTETVE